MKTSVAVLVVFALAGPAVAQVKYVDEAGNSHYAQNENMVPEQYRAKAAPVGSLPRVRMDGSQGGATYTGPMYGISSDTSRLEREDRRGQQKLNQAAEQNHAQKRADEAKRAACNRRSGSDRPSVDCFVR